MTFRQFFRFVSRKLFGFDILGASLGIAGMLMQTHSGTSLINPDLADMLFKSAAMTTAPMSVTGDHGCQEFYSDLYQKQHSYPQG